MSSSRTSSASCRRVLLSLDSVPAETRPLAVGLHWALSALRAQWAAMHVRSQGAGPPTVLVATPAPADATGGGGALFDFLSDEIQETLGRLANRTMSLGHTVSIGGGRGAAHQIRLPCAALCVPLLDQDSKASVGTVTLLCNDAARSWSADEQSLLATAAPLFGQFAMKERLAAQAALISGAMSGGEQQRSTEMADHAAKVVCEMRGVHADKLRQQRDAHREEIKTVVSEHLNEKQQLEEALKAAREQVEATERNAAVRMHKMLEGVELSHSTAPPRHERVCVLR
jgi:hypothetical protein